MKTRLLAASALALIASQASAETLGVSIVNYDNNQHGPDENLRLQNLWEGIEMLAAIMTMPK
jgi:acetylornithine deacetylase/succinyl-diaminopimelate desuccinylase-like protein